MRKLVPFVTYDATCPSGKQGHKTQSANPKSLRAYRLVEQEAEIPAKQTAGRQNQNEIQMSNDKLKSSLSCTSYSASGNQHSPGSPAKTRTKQAKKLSVFNAVKKYNRKGYFLLELIMIMVLISICMLPITGAIGMASQRSVLNERKTIAKNLAESVMEEYMNKSFSSTSSVSATSFSAPFSAYSYEVACYYVTSADYNTNAGAQTEFKRLEVKIYYNNAVVARMVSIKSDYLNDEA